MGVLVKTRDRRAAFNGCFEFTYLCWIRGRAFMRPGGAWPVSVLQQAQIPGRIPDPGLWPAPVCLLELRTPWQMAVWGTFKRGNTGKQSACRPSLKGRKLWESSWKAGAPLWLAPVQVELVPSPCCAIVPEGE